jgi:hypothetical protein
MGFLDSEEQTTPKAETKNEPTTAKELTFTALKMGITISCYAWKL